MKNVTIGLLWVSAAVLVSTSLGLASLPDPGLRWVATVVDVGSVFFMSVALPSLLAWLYEGSPTDTSLEDRVRSFSKTLQPIMVASLITMAALYVSVLLAPRTHLVIKPGKHLFVISSLTLLLSCFSGRVRQSNKAFTTFAFAAAISMLIAVRLH